MQVIQKITHKDIGDYLKKAATGNNEAVNSDGGHLIAQAVVSEIVDNLELASPLWDKARKFPLEGYGNNGLRIPYNNTSGEVTATTGARAYWVAEAGEKTISKAQIGQSAITCGKLVVRIPTTDELKQDSTLLADFIVDEATKAITNSVEYYMIRGSSTQAVQGIANAADKATLISNCSANITEGQMVGFVDKLNPIYHNTAEWYVSPQQYTTLVANTDYTNETALVWDSSIAKYRLMGFPVTALPQLTGDPYHIILGDFGVYGLVYRLDINVSEHIRFDYDESEWRIVMRIGGHVLTESQVLQDGNTYGAFVVPEGGEAAGSSSSSSSSSSSHSSSSSSSSVEYSSSSSSVDSSSSSSSSSGGNSSSSSSSSG